MKKYVYVAISLAVGVGVLKACCEQKKRGMVGGLLPDTVSEYIQIPLEEEKVEQTIPVPVYVVDDTYNVIKDTPSSNYMDVVDYSYVNDELYQNLVMARDNYHYLFMNGEVSSQMRNNGIVLSQGEVEYIDTNMKMIYRFIEDYVNAYRAGDFNACNGIGKTILEYQGMDKSYLFQILVSKKLPVEYQSGIDFNRYEGIYDEFGNILLNNGRRIRLLGGKDAIISADPYPTDTYNKMIQLSEWYQTLPTIIYDQYSTVRNRLGDDGICYVWNQTMVERTCNREWEMIKKNGQEMYGFNPETTSVIWDSNNVSYVYEDIYGQHYLLDSMGNARVDHIFDVQDAIVSGEGEVYFLDNYVKNMRAYQEVFQYKK